MPVLPNGQIMPYTMGGQPGMQVPRSGGIFGLAGTQPQMQGPRFTPQQGANPVPGMGGGQMRPAFGGANLPPALLAQLQQRQRMFGAAPGAMQGRYAQNLQPQIPAATAGQAAPQIPAGMVPQVQAYAAQRTQQPGAQRLTGMQQGMTSGMPSQNLQGVQTGAQDYVTNRRRGILGGAV